MGRIAMFLTTITAGAIAAASAPTAARAQSVDLATELMMEDALAIDLFIGELFDPSAGSKLSYDTDVASDGASYSFSTVAGSMLDGQPFSLTGSAAEVAAPMPGVEVWMSKDAGLPGLSVTDKETTTKNADGTITVEAEYKRLDKKGNLVEDITQTTIYDLAKGKDGDAGFFSDKNGMKVPKSDFVSTSRRLPDGEWENKVTPVYPELEPKPMPIFITGYSPVLGGDGYFTVTFGAVPEPSTWAMMLVGFGGLGFAAYRRGRAARSVA